MLDWNISLSWDFVPVKTFLIFLLLVAHESSNIVFSFGPLMIYRLFQVSHLYITHVINTLFEKAENVGIISNYFVWDKAVLHFSHSWRILWRKSRF